MQEYNLIFQRPYILLKTHPMEALSVQKIPLKGMYSVSTGDDSQVASI